MKMPKTIKGLISLMVLLFISQSSMAQFQPGDFINPLPIPYLAKGINVGDTITINNFYEQFFHNFDPQGSSDSFIPANTPDTSTSGTGRVINNNLYDIDTFLTA